VSDGSHFALSQHVLSFLLQYFFAVRNVHTTNDDNQYSFLSVADISYKWPVATGRVLSVLSVGLSLRPL